MLEEEGWGKRMCGSLFHVIWASNLKCKILQYVKSKPEPCMGMERRWIKTEIKLIIYYFNICTDPGRTDPMPLSCLSLWFWILIFCTFQLETNLEFFLSFLDNQGKGSAELSRKRDEITNFSPEDIWSWISFRYHTAGSYHQWRRKWRSLASLLRETSSVRTQWNRLCPEKGRGSEKSTSKSK